MKIKVYDHNDNGKKHEVDDNNDEAMVQNKVPIKKAVKNYEFENADDSDGFTEIHNEYDPIEHSKEDFEMQMSKCHIRDMKYKNSHFFRFHPQFDVKTENAIKKYKLKPCFVKMDCLIKNK